MTEQTETIPPIDYEWYLTGPQGARFILYPVEGKHTEDDVKRAKHWLHREHDVVSLQIRWNKKGDDSPPPEKIPDFIMLKELKKQLGEKESYIQELQDDLQRKETDINRELKQQIKSQEMYKSLKDQLDKAKKEIKNLRSTISDLIVKLNHKE